MWTWVPIFLLASFAAAGLDDPALAEPGGVRGRRRRRRSAASSPGRSRTGSGARRRRSWRWRSSGTSAVVVGAAVRRAGAADRRAWRSSGASSVVADSAQFSSAVSELAPPGTAGSALSVQTAVGFTLTGVTILGRRAARSRPTPVAGGSRGASSPSGRSSGSSRCCGCAADPTPCGWPAATDDRRAARLADTLSGMTRSAALEELRSTAPDIVARVATASTPSALLSVRREVRRRAGPGTAARIVPQLAVAGDALAGIVRTLPETAFGMARRRGGLDGRPGGRSCRRCSGRPRDGGVPRGAAAASRPTHPRSCPASRVRPTPRATHLVRRLATTQRIMERAARAIAGHEVTECPLVHPLVGRLRCGEWLLFAGVHDLMHLEQLQASRRGWR